MKIEKRGYEFPMSREMFKEDAWASDYFRVTMAAAVKGVPRKESYVRFIPADPAKVAEYERLEAMLREIEASDLWMPGDDGGYLEKPETRREVVYAETFEEWAARVEAAPLPTAEEIFRNFGVITIDGGWVVHDGEE
jgi:hypothetical protein